MLDRGQKLLDDADSVSCLYYIEEVKNRGLNFHDILKKELFMDKTGFSEKIQLCNSKC